MNINKQKNTITLRDATLKGEVDASILDGWIKETKITITAVLNNTAVYYLHNGRTDRRFAESLELIQVNESDIKYLPVRELPLGARGKTPPAKRTA
jgi:hypothetical protein